MLNIISTDITDIINNIDTIYCHTFSGVQQLAA